MVIPSANPLASLCAVLLAALIFICGFAPPSRAATISFVGVEAGTAGSGYSVQNWSNPGVSKVYDLGGSEVYGTSGYYQIRPMPWDPGALNIYQGASSGNNLGITATNDPTLYSAPVFLSSITGAAGDYVNFPGYPIFRGPDGSALYREGSLSVAVNNGPYNTPSGSSSGYFGEAFSFSMASNMGANFRIGIAVDTVSSGTYAPDYVTIYNSGTGSTYSTQLTRDGTPDMVFFDLTASAGENFSAALWQLVGTQSAAAFGLITFDVSRYNLDVASGLQTNSTTLGGAPAALLKTGAGTTVLTAVSTYQGATTISNGAVEVGGAGRLASGNYTGSVALATNTASLRIATSASQTLSGAISGNGSLSKSANGTLTLSGSNSYVGGTTISGGRLIATSSNALGDASSAVTVSGGAYLDVRTNITRTGTVTFDGGYLATADGAPASLVNNGGGFILTNAAEIVAQLGGSAGLTSGGTGTAILWRSNSYTGATVVNSGTLRLDGSGGLSTNTALQVASGATFSSTGTFLTSNNLTIAGLTGAGTVTGGAGSLTIDKASSSDTFSGQIAGGLRLNKAGAGTLVLSGSNSYSGGTLISAGVLALNNGVLSGGITNNASLVIYGDLANAVSGTGSVTKTGSANTAIWVSNTYSGATVVEGGSVKLDGAGMISSNSALRVDSGASFSITGFFTGSNNVTVAGLTGAGIVQGAAGTLTVSKPTAGSDVFTGSIQGGIGLTLDGAMQLWLGGSNNYTGTTAIKSGQLVVNHGSGLGATNGGTTVADGAQLRLVATNSSGFTIGNEALQISGDGVSAGGALRNATGTNTYQGKITLLANATIGAASGAPLTISGSPIAIEAANFTLGFTGAGSTYVNGAINLGSGGVTKTGSGFTTFNAGNNFTGALTVSEGTVNLNASSGAAAGAATSVSVAAANGGTLLISQSNQVNDAATVTLSGGTISRASGVSEVFGNLNLTSGSFIDFGTGTGGTLRFGTYAPSSLLTVNNFFVGNTLVFGSDIGSFIAASSAGPYSGTYFAFDQGFTTTAWNGSTFTITAIPESSTLVAAGALLIALGLFWWRDRAPARRVV